MAQLLSEEQECPSVLTIAAGAPKEISGQDWQYVLIGMISGRRDVRSLENEDTLVCRRPTDEIAQLIISLGKLLDHKIEELLFEPSEPSFELCFSRLRRGGIKVEAWLDAGNGTTGICTWDACGIRFATTDEFLKQFIAELAAEFDVPVQI
jgi:hypothetical protein